MAGKDRPRGIKLIALLLALLASAFTFIWVLTNDIHFTWRAGGNAPSSSAASTPGEPLQLRDARAAAPAEVAAPLKTVPEQGAAEPNQEAEHIPEPLHQPDYGELLRRGGASAVFTLRDAQGAMLVEPPERVHLFRNLGQYWLIDQCEYVDGEIRCVGLSGTGLEPGEYELEIDARRYGRLQHKFRVTRGQNLSGEIRTPYWRRIICLKFVDPNGEPVKWIHRWPRYRELSTDQDASQLRASRHSPPTTLHAPGRRQDTRSREDTRIHYERGSSLVDLGDNGEGPFATDEGRVYALVYAGARASLVSEFLAAVWGTEGETYESTFDSPEWDAKFVVLPISDQLAAHVERKGAKSYDPGRRSLLKGGPLVQLVLQPRGRLVVTLSGPDALVPKYRQSFAGDEQWALDIRDYLPMAREGDRWVAQLYSTDPVKLLVTDGQTFVSEPELIDLAGQAELHVARHFSAITVPRPEFRLPPTLAALQTEGPVSLYFQGDEASIDTKAIRFFPSVRDGTGPLLFAEPAFHQLSKWPDAGAYLRIESAYDAESYGRPQHELTHSFWRGSGEEFFHRLTAGEFTITCELQGALAFRAVGDLGEGLPWVQSSILPYEYDRTATELRGLVPDIRAGGIDLLELDGSSWMVRHVLWAREKAAKPGAAAETYAQFLPERLAELVTDPDARYWLALNRAWYAMHNQVSTDEHGYGWSEDAALEPGKLYVLYLWSQSCDDLQPDRRVVFQATEGVTDLGVITLPSYR